MRDVILQEYEIRKSNKEKAAFIEYIKARLSNAGYDVENDIKIETKGKGILKSRNIVVGNLESAKVVLTAHYDTCAVLPFPNFMAPTNVPLFAASQIIITLFIVAIAFAATMIVALLTGNTIPGGLVFLFFLYLMLFHMLIGYRNKHTANDNTSGVITITRILERLSEEDRSKVCVVYFDNEEKGLLGSDFFKSKHKKEMKDKLLLNFDCVGDGRNIVVLAKKKMQDDELYKLFLDTLQESAAGYDVEFVHGNMKPMMFGSDQMHFKKGVGVCALRKSKIGMYIARIHTPFDTKCRKENIAYLVEGTKQFIGKS